jgi:hypothetical protein
MRQEKIMAQRAQERVREGASMAEHSRRLEDEERAHERHFWSSHGIAGGELHRKGMAFAEVQREADQTQTTVQEGRMKIKVLGRV